MSRFSVPAETLLFSEGEPGRVAFLIASGAVDIFIRRNGAERVLARRQAGEIIGEMAIVSAGPRSACAKSVTACELVPITSAQVEVRIAAIDPVLRTCVNAFIDRAREALAANPYRSVATKRPMSHLYAREDFDRSVETLTIEHDLALALRRHEIDLVFDPVVELGAATLRGVVAEMRWAHPTRGVIRQKDFIRIAETTGTAEPVMDWYFGEAARAYKDISAAWSPGQGALFIAVTLSAKALLGPDLAARIRRIGQRHRLPPGWLVLQITEQTITRDPVGARTALARLHADDIPVWIQQFGTGSSSLSGLATLPVAAIKVDKSFVQADRTDPKNRKIVEMMRKLADDLGIVTVADGIDDPTQLEHVGDMKFHFGQGRLYGSPRPLTDMIDAVRVWAPARLAEIEALCC